MEINYWAVMVCALVSVGLRELWFGPMFGTTWLRVCGDVNKNKIFKNGVHFLVSLFQIWVLVFFIRGWGVHSVGLPPTYFENAMWIWLAFVVPTIASGSMYSADTPKIAWTKFGIQAGYQFCNFFLCGLILGVWR